jgi:prepilin-type N-terminal cleavage/methylation domain-containing protein
VRLPDNNDRGFTLVEMLFVVLLLGVVTTAVYSLYLTHLKSAYSQDETVEVQQNLRIAMDAISRDLKVAGIMVPFGTLPFSNTTTNYRMIKMNTVSPDGRYARVGVAGLGFATYTSKASTTFTVKVDSAASVDGFSRLTNPVVRIVKSFDSSQPLAPAATGVTLFVSASDRTVPSMTLKQSDSTNFTAGTPLNTGDMIAMATNNGTAANLAFDTISYFLVNNATLAACPAGQACLARSINGKSTDGTSGADVIATNLIDDTNPLVIAGTLPHGLRFSFLYDNAPEDNSPSAGLGLANDLTQINAIRITLTGATNKGVLKTRQLTSVVRLRNRRTS